MQNWGIFLRTRATILASSSLLTSHAPSEPPSVLGMNQVPVPLNVDLFESPPPRFCLACKTRTARGTEGERRRWEDAWSKTRDDGGADLRRVDVASTNQQASKSHDKRTMMVFIFFVSFRATSAVGLQRKGKEWVKRKRSDTATSVFIYFDFLDDDRTSDRERNRP